MPKKEINLDELLAAPPPPPGPFPLAMHRGYRFYLRRRRLGSGGFGEAYEYLMLDPSNLNRMRVAIKRIVYHGEHPDLRTAWIAETSAMIVYAAAAPHNPRIVEFLSPLEYEGELYIVMELCDGSLEDLFALPGYNGARWVVPVGTAVLTGLVDLHAERGAVHGDLRNPANILYVGGQADRLNPDAYTFKMADLGATKRWDNLTPDTPDSPDNVDETRITEELRDVAGILLEVAVGGEHNMPPEALDQIDVPRLVPGAPGAAIARVIRGEFVGDDGAKDFLAALTRR